jgi:hypothetical protein
MGFLAQCVYKRAHQKTEFSLNSPSNAPKLKANKLYASNDLFYFVKDFKRDVNIQENEIVISSDDSFSAFIGGDIRFTVDTIKFSTWLDVEFGRSNQNDGDIQLL